MGEITDIIRVYVVPELLDDFSKDFSLDLRANIKDQLYDGHGYDTGNLKRNIRTDVRPLSKTSRMITGYYDEGNADYGIFVIRGIRGKGRVTPIDFLGDGLKATLEAYR